MTLSASSSNHAPGSSWGMIALIGAYFVAVWLIPEGWLDTALGSVAFAVARTVNPYLSEYSVALAKNPQYFMHCHVLAVWMVPVPFMYQFIRVIDDRAQWVDKWREKLEKFGGAFMYVLCCTAFLGLLYGSMLWLAEYPLSSRAERSVWVNSVALYALVLSGLQGAWLMCVYVAFSAAFEGGKSAKVKASRDQRLNKYKA